VTMGIRHIVNIVSLQWYHSSDGYHGNSRPSLLWFVAAMGADVTLPIVVVTSNSDGRLTSDCPSLLVFTATSDNATSDYLVTAEQIQI
jgi:hypothetical protein